MKAYDHIRVYREGLELREQVQRISEEKDSQEERIRNLEMMNQLIIENFLAKEQLPQIRQELENILKNIKNK